MTCQRQPALGCVYKLVEINSNPRTKLSEDMEKATMPGNKNVYRLYSMDGHALIDLLQKNDEPAPVVGQRVLCRHPLQESKRAYVTPSRVEPLYKVTYLYIFSQSKNSASQLTTTWHFNFHRRFTGKMVRFFNHSQHSRRYVKKCHHHCDHCETITSVHWIQRRTKCRSATNCTASFTICGSTTSQFWSYHDR